MNEDGCVSRIFHSDDEMFGHRTPHAAPTPAFEHRQNMCRAVLIWDGQNIRIEGRESEH